MNESVTTYGNRLYSIIDQIYDLPAIKDYSFETEVYGERFRVLYSHDKSDKTIEIKSINTISQVEEFFCPIFLNRIEEKCWEDLKCNQ